MNVAIGFGKLNEHVQDCSTWTMVEKQPKTPYPPPPRFLPCKDMWMSLAAGFRAASGVVSERLQCWNFQSAEHVAMATIFQ
jgi:hypothetical protein